MSAGRLAWALLAVLFLISLGDWLGDEERHFVDTETTIYKEAKVMTQEQFNQLKLRWDREKGKH